MPRSTGTARQRSRADAAKAPPAGDKGAAPNRKPYMLIAAGILAAVLVAVVVVIATRKPAGDAMTPDDKTVSDTPKVTPVAQEKKENDVEPTEPEARKKWLLDNYEQRTRATPDAFGDLLVRLDTIEGIFEKDNNWVVTIESRIRSLKQRAEKKAEEVAESLGGSAMKKADGGDYKGAMAELDKFPADLSRTEASSRIFYYRKKLSDKALAQYQSADARAQQLCDAANLAGALGAYDAVATFGLPQIDKLVAMRRAEIKDAATRGKNPSEGKTVDLSEQQAFFRADVYVSLPGMTPAFDTAYHEGALGSEENAKEKIDLAQYPRSAVFYYARALRLAREGSMEEARWNGTQASRLALPNEAFRSRLLCLDGRLALFGGGNMQVALEKAQAALDLDPKNADALFLLGIVHTWTAEYLAPQSHAKEDQTQIGNDYFKAAVKADAQYARVVPKAVAAEAGAPDAEKYKYTGSGGNPYLVSVVLVNGRTALGEGEGTGFVVHSTPQLAHIITNDHVIKGFAAFIVTYQYEAFGNLARKTSSKVKILQTDPVNDLALLEVATEKEIKPLPLRPTTTGLTLPMKLTMIGHPLGLDFTVITGELASLDRIRNGRRHLQINSNVDFGMSGGPVIDEAGCVVGVTVAKLPGLGQSLAILTEHVRDMCAKAGITIELRQPPAQK